VIIAAVIGARLYYVFLNFDDFRHDLLSIINPFHDGYIGISGLVMYGGFLCAITAAIVFLRVKKVHILPYLDMCAPSVGVGIALTRIGCFLNGCCYGAAAKAGSILCVHYPNVNSPAGYYQYRVGAEGLLPSQFYEAFGGLIIALIIYIAGKSKPFTGLQFYILVFLYSILRFCIDFTRVYPFSEKIGPLSHNQALCIVLFVIFGGLIIRKFLAGKDKTKKSAGIVLSEKSDRQFKNAAD
jgi:phosphatidylglycerol:prolipoprotein diacylglycerol transferase